MMRDIDPSSLKATKKRRSRIACKRCHDRRVKCDVSVIGTPCSGCTASNLDPECQILNSKRVRGGNGRFSTRDAPEMSQRPLTPLESISGQTESIENPPSPEETEDSRSASQQAPADEADIWSRVVSYQTRLPSDGQRVVYVGEPWTLAYVMQWKGRQRQGMADATGSPNRLSTESPTAVHVSVPIENQTSPDSQLQSQSSTAAISTANASDLPADIQQALIKSYFSRHNILYPVLDSRRFGELSRSHTVDPCLHLAVLYAGALHVPDPIIYRAGFDSRQACLISLYRRAKTIFFQNDDDGTVDQLSYIQSAFLLHNMWQGPNATLDPWTWLGLAIRMAQNIGMHRSTQSSSLPEPDKRLWKRIWWCLYTRDRQIASALGKPLMIRDEDCDVEPLTVGDFEEGDSEQTRYYVIEQARLSILFGTTISKLFTVSPHDSAQRDASRANLMQQVNVWKDELPSLLSCRSYRGLDAVPFQGLLLEVLFNCLVLLIQRGPLRTDINNTDSQEASRISFESSVEAAGKIARVAETIMNHGSLTDCPLFFTSALFGAMTIHAIRGQEAEQQLSLCMIAMRPLSTMYFAAGWIRNLFKKLNEKRANSARPSRPPSPVRPSEMETEQVIPSSSTNNLAEVIPGNTSQMSASDVHRENSWPQFDAWPPTSAFPAFGLISRNVGGFLDYPTMLDGGFGGMDPYLADCWQDLLNVENTFTSEDHIRQ